MIEIRSKVKDGRYKLSVKGHAGSDEKGRDTVCAAVSALVYTLAQNIKDCEKSGMIEKNPTVRLNEGDSYLSYRPKKGHEQSTLILFLGIQRGFELLQSNHPRYVNINSLVTPVTE